MGKFLSDAKELLAAIGGKDNITAVSHCITRMRFVLTDPKIADIKRIESIKSVKGTFTRSFRSSSGMKLLTSIKTLQKFRAFRESRSPK